MTETAIAAAIERATAHVHRCSYLSTRIDVPGFPGTGALAHCGNFILDPDLCNIFIAFEAAEQPGDALSSQTGMRTRVS